MKNTMWRAYTKISKPPIAGLSTVADHRYELMSSDDSAVLQPLYYLIINY